MIADVDVQEFVHIRNPDPVGLLNHCVMARILQRLHLIASPLRGVGKVPNNARLRQRIEHPIRAVGAIVGVEQEIRYAEQPVKGDPFNQERAFVLDASHRGDTHRVIPAGAVGLLVLWSHHLIPLSALLLGLSS